VTFYYFNLGRLDLCKLTGVTVRRWQVSGGTEGTKLQLGDVLVAIDGTPLRQGLDMAGLLPLLRGEPRSMVDLGLVRGWAQIPIQAQLQRRGARRPKPPRPPGATKTASRDAAAFQNLAAGGSRRDPSFRDLPAPAFRQMPPPQPGAGTASRERLPLPTDMGPLPAPGSRRPSPQSSMSSPGPGGPDNRHAAGAPARPAHSAGGTGAQDATDSAGPSPCFITPVTSQVSLSSSTPHAPANSAKASPVTSELVVQRLTRQVERFDAELKQREREKQGLEAAVLERDAAVRQLEEAVKQHALDAAHAADIAILKDLRARVQMLEGEVECKDGEIAELREDVGRLERQIGVTSTPGSALSFLNDLIGVKNKSAQEAERAKHEAEEAKTRMQEVAQQSEDKERMIRELEQAREELHGKVQEDGQEAEALRERVKSLEAALKAQLRSVMDQLVDATKRNEVLAADNDEVRRERASVEEQARQAEAKCHEHRRTVDELRALIDSHHSSAQTAEQALRARVEEAEAAMEACKVDKDLVHDKWQVAEARAEALSQVSAAPARRPSAASASCCVSSFGRSRCMVCMRCKHIGACGRGDACEAKL
jgi:hypothetical protein